MRIVSCAKLSLVVLWASLPLSARAQDSGAHWVSIGPWGGFVTNLVIDASDPRMLYLTTYNGGVFRSHDRGDTSNPFNAATTIPYQVAVSGLVRLEVFDLAGQRVRALVAGLREPGRHLARWDGMDEVGRRMASGVYLVRMESRTRTDCIAVVLVR